MSNHPHAAAHVTDPKITPAQAWLSIAIAAALGLPSVVLRQSGEHIAPELTALVCGVGILGAAFLLSWTLEVAQMHISASLAIAILALVAILPEYAIEAVLAWDAGAAWHAGANPADIPAVSRVAANVTGANRLLIGLGWSAVALLFWIKNRKELIIDRDLSLEFTVLTLATLLTFLLFILKEVTIYLSVILIGLYLFYLWASSRKPSEEPELMGPPAIVGRLPYRRQLTVIIVLFLYAAGVIFAAAEPFVDGLIETGAEFGISEFTLIQWLAPLASESPELVIAVLLTLRANAAGGITTLISSGVNQLTLLIGCMPLVFSISYGEVSGFPLDSQQGVEFFLTSALSLFAIGLLARLRIPWYGAAALLLLFLAHLFFTDPDARRIFAIIYLALAGVLLIADLGRLKAMWQMAMVAFYLTGRDRV